MRSQSEIDDVLNEVEEAVDTGEHRFPGMCYEEGVAAALRWVMGASEEHPYPEH